MKVCPRVDHAKSYSSGLENPDRGGKGHDVAKFLFDFTLLIAGCHVRNDEKRKFVVFSDVVVHSDDWSRLFDCFGVYQNVISTNSNSNLLDRQIWISF